MTTSSPRVISTTAKTGWPIIFRNAVRSMRIPNPATTTAASATASGNRSLMSSAVHQSSQVGNASSWPRSVRGHRRGYWPDTKVKMMWVPKSINAP